MLGRAYAMGVNLVLHVFLARSMAPEQYGMLLVALNTAIFVSTLAMAGLNQGIIKLVAGDGARLARRERAALVRTLGTILAIALALVCIGGWLLFGTLVGRWLELPATVVLLTFLAGAALALEQLGSAALRSLHALGPAALLDGKTGGMLTKTVYLALAAGLVAVGLDLDVAAALGLMSASFLVLTPLFLRLLRGAWWRTPESLAAPVPTGSAVPPAPGLRSVLSFNAVLLQSQVLLFVITRSDVWIAGAQVAKDEAALYGAARWLILQTIAPLQVISMTITSSIAQLHAEGRRDELEALLRFSTSVYCVLTLPLLLVLAAFGGPLMGLLYGEHYAATGTVLTILAFGQMINCITGNSGQALAMGGQAATLLWANVAAAIAQVGLGWWLAGRHGIEGLAVATTIVIVGRSAALWWLARTRAGVWSHPTLRPRRMLATLR